MRVLVTWGSKRGGTEGIALMLAEALQARGFDVLAVSAPKAPRVEGFDAVVVGGALYGNRWPANVRRFVRRNVRALRRVPVWLFSSGPLDDSAERETLAAPTQVAVLAERIGARGHVTFGGRLDSNAKGFPASAMAKTGSGAWRNPERICAWGATLADDLPTATAGRGIDHPARAISRSVAHGVIGGAVCATILFAGQALLGAVPAVVLHALAAPAVFAVIAAHYFRARGARDPLPTAVVWTALIVVLDVCLAGALQGSLAILTSVAASWLPFTLVFLATWITGFVLSTMPWPKRPDATAQSTRGAHPGTASS